MELMNFDKSLLASKPKPGDINFRGCWENGLGSVMEIDQNGNSITGKYRTGVGKPEPEEEFELTGYASGDLIVFCVNFGRYDSLTAWAGQHTFFTGAEEIHTLWHLARDISDPKEKDSLWSGILAGANKFTRQAA